LTIEQDKKFRQALELCASEPVHTPGAIQPAGCLVVLDALMERITHISANIADYLGVNSADAVGMTPEKLLGDDVLKQMRKQLPQQQEPPRVFRTTRKVDGRVRQYQVSLYRSDEYVVGEFEASQHDLQDDVLVTVDSWMLRMSGAETVGVLFDTLCEAVRVLTGYDRIKVYAFDPDWHGTVVAENRNEKLPALLGHSFPASDIPPQVRALYDINPVRVIPDATVESVPLVVAGDGDDVPLDLSPGVLRAVSPVHRMYMANMETAASFSIGIHSRGKLWGILAGHARQPRCLAPVLREAAHAMVQLAAQRLGKLNVQAESAFLKQVRGSRALLVGGMQGQMSGPESILREKAAMWLALFHSCGCVLLDGERQFPVGAVPEAEVLAKVRDWLDAGHMHTTGIWQSHRLSHTELAGLVPPGVACGMMAIPLPLGRPGCYLLLFRPEKVRTYRWAGEPYKLIREENGVPSISPRRSFAVWEEEVKGQSLEWSELEQDAVLDVAENLAVAISRQEIVLVNEQLKREQQALKIANERLKKLAHTDPLTQIWNRLRMEAIIDAELSAARRYGRYFAFLLFDIDHFKAINDRHGHEAGDRVLVAVTEAVYQSLRDTDHFGRWGGEEFVVLATHSDLEQGIRLAERLREVVEGLKIDGIGTVTASFGVVAWRDGDTRRALVNRADQAMYYAKEAGRNGVASEKPIEP